MAEEVLVLVLVLVLVEGRELGEIGGPHRRLERRGARGRPRDSRVSHA